MRILISDDLSPEAKAILEREALLQNAPDGVNREQATSYQQFTFDLLLLPLLGVIQRFFAASQTEAKMSSSSRKPPKFSRSASAASRT